MKNIILTGATSMIGSAIVAEALAQNKNVTAIVRKNSPQIDNLLRQCKKDMIKIIECEIQDYKTLNFNTPHDAFLHLAWQNTDADSRDDVYTHSNNITYTLDAVNAAHRAGCKMFMCAGSQAECGRISEKVNGDTVCNPESGYGIAKYAAGKLARLAALKYGMRYCHARILSAYGEGMGDNSLIIYLIKTLLAGGKPSLTGCEQLWDFIYSQDAARAMMAIVENGIDGKTYAIGSGEERPLWEYVNLIREIVNPSAELGFGEKDYYPHQPMYLCADIRELQADTGFKPVVGFEDGIKRTVESVSSRM